MSTSKHIDKICLVVLAVVIVATVLFINGKHFGITPVIDEDAENFSEK